MSRYLRLIAVCAGLLASAGCSSERRLPTAPTPSGPAGPIDPAPPQPPSAPQRLAALALMEAVIVHKGLTTSPLIFATSDGKVWTDGPCVSVINGIPEIYGSLQGSLDGGLPPTSGTFLPTGSHTYVVSFSNCLVAYLSGTELNGVASAAYRTADWSNVTAMVSADSLRGRGELGYFSELYDVTADGSAVWTQVGSQWSTTTYTPATGSRLVNNSTTNVATFGGGSYSAIQYPPPQGSSASVEYRFDNLKIAINGTEYTLNGSLEITYGSSSGSRTHTGEIRIINNGTLVARIYGDVRNALTIEVLVPLVPL
jgi:hypothetical protein